MKAVARRLEEIAVIQAESTVDAERIRILLNDVRARAHQRYADRGGESGHDLEDWLEAERELGIVPAKIEETAMAFHLLLQGIECPAKNLKVIVEPNAVTLAGISTASSEPAHGSGLAMQEVRLFGRYVLPCSIDPNVVTATLNKGVVEIMIPKEAVVQ